jgi:hypothetical protein
MIRRGRRQRQFLHGPGNPGRAGFSASVPLVLWRAFRGFFCRPRPHIPLMTAST